MGQNLLSSYLMRCARNVGRNVDVENLFVRFRQPALLKAIVEKAKSMLAADRDFFEGSYARKRIVAGKVADPNVEPSYRVFIREIVVENPGSWLSIVDCQKNYVQFCRERGLPAIASQNFKGLISETIRNERGLALRHDLRDERGRWHQGWKGLRLASQDQNENGLNIAVSELPRGPSVH